MQLDLECKLAADDTGAVTGLAWPFGTIDRVGDVIEKGAFAGARAPLPMLWSHDPQAVIGQWSSITETDRGLEVRGSLNLAVPKAAEVHSLLQRGDVTGLSIGFRTLKSKPRQGGGRSISALDLAEISVVSIPANPAAKVESVKSARSASASPGESKMDPEELAAAVADLEKKLAELEPQSTKVASLEAELAKLRAKSAELETRLNRPGAGGADEAKARAEAERKSFENYMRKGFERMENVEAKALTVADDGGAIAPPAFGAEVLKLLRQFSPIRQYARVVTIGASEIKYPRRTGSTAAVWTAENTDRTGSEPTYEQVSLTPYELATFVESSQALLEDAAYDLAGEIAADLAESFAIAEGTAFVSGNGTGKPKGILAASGIAELKTGNATGFATATPWTILSDLFHALPQPFAQNGVWIMNRTTLGTIRKFVDANGRPIVIDGLAAGAPATILGRPVAEAVDMPNVAAGAYPIAFADLSGYRIADRIGFSLLRDPYSVASKGNVRFHARRRVGADVTHPDRFVKLKVSA